MDFVKPMLNAPGGHSAEIVDDFMVKARVEAARQSTRMLMSRAYYNEAFRLYSPEDWMRLLLIWETLRVRNWRKENPEKCGP